jgi:hypothetical protein
MKMSYNIIRLRRSPKIRQWMENPPSENPGWLNLAKIGQFYHFMTIASLPPLKTLVRFIRENGGDYGLYLIQNAHTKKKVLKFELRRG